MKKLFECLMVLSFVFIHNCSQKTHSFGETKNIKIDLLDLSYHTLSKKLQNDSLITNYKDIDLKKILIGKKTEFKISNKKIIEYTLKNPDSTFRGSCYLEQIFKKNFLLISKGNCSAASSGTFKRDDLLIIDLNSSNVFKSDLGGLSLTMSKKYNDYCCAYAKNYYAILNINLEDKYLVIHNNFGRKLIKMIPYDKLEF